MAFSPGSIRKHLLALVIAIAVPLLGLSGTITYLSYQAQRETLARGLSNTANAVSAAVDREFMSSTQALKILASSNTLTKGHLPEFYEEMKRALAGYGHPWQNIVLADRTGQQLINLRFPLGSPLPRLDPILIERNLQTGEPTISDLFSGPVTGMPSIVVSVPVLSNGQIKYLLRVGYSPARLSDLVSQQKLPPSWLATIIDRNQIIAARTRDLEKFLGKHESASFIASARQNRETIWRGTTLDGIDVVSSLHRSALTGWAVELAVPAAEVEAQLSRSLTLVGVIGSVLVVAGLFFAVGIGRRIALSAIQLADAAHGLGRGETLRLPPSSILELNEVARAVEAAAVKRIQVEKVLAESEERFRRAFEDASSGMSLTHPSGRYLKVNDAFCRMLGYSASELMQMTFQDITHPDDMDTNLDAHRRAIAGDTPGYTLEKRYRSKDGTAIWVMLTASLMRNDDAEPVYFVSQMTDITERKQAEEALRESAARLSSIVNSAMDGIITVNENREIVLFNPAAEKMFSHSAARLLGRPLNMLIPARFHEAHDQHVQEFGETGVTSRTMGKLGQIVGLRANGDEFLIEASISHAAIGTGKLYTVILRDISERKRAEDELQQSYSRLQELSRRLVEVEEEERRNINRELHDRVGQDLAAAKLNIELVRATLGEDERRFLGQRLDAAQRLLQSAIDHARNIMADLRPQGLDEFGLFTALQMHAEAVAKHFGIPVRMGGADPKPRLPRTVETAFYRIAQEALNNVAKHARAKNVEITLDVRGQDVTLTIADDGAGFDVGKAPANSYGMRIMGERAEVTGARLEIDSAPGRGTRIIVSVDHIA